MRLCRCGAIVKSRCLKCYPHPKHKRTTADRGYDNRWKVLSERKRHEHPLCQRCEEQGIVRVATEVHHVRSIESAPWLRLEWTNLMSVCRACHREIEGQSCVA